ncbi:hypothetical protein HWV62_11181 [Athelia sp. TMB]|nr:hypothetical protein HWV62_11181 [Athelia sp. TMB]
MLATPDGLLLRPYVAGVRRPTGLVRIAWGREGSVQEIQEDTAENWESSVIIYGIVGVLQLTFASYLLVITARNEIGQLFDPSHPVYSVRSVIPIPLTHARATIALNTLASSRNAQSQTRPSLIPRNTVDSSLSSHDGSDMSESESEADRLATPTAARVTFAPNDYKKPLKSASQPKLEEANPQTGSGASTPGSEDSLTVSPITKTIAERLSFWTRLSKRDPSTMHSIDDVISTDGQAEERPSLDSIASSANTNAISSILAETAPPPKSAEEQKSELETKIVREVVKEFTKGGMYFAYHFGELEIRHHWFRSPIRPPDITRSLQHKQAQVSKSHKQNTLLASLNALPEVPSSSSKRKSRGASRSATEPPLSPNAPNSPVTERLPVDEHVDPLPEPYPTLPLWRRVDRHFWWNEWLSKPFVDAGLHSYVLPIMQGHFQISQFHIPREPVANETGDVAVADYIVISRRSRDRAGLRYQRRGLDEDAHTANFVESESIMRVEREGFVNVFSYVQIRGSIPLFWTQTGYGLKPPPVMSPDRTHEQNMNALKRHFGRTVPEYGPVNIVNLAEQQGKEGSITTAYRECVGELGNKDVIYLWISNNSLMSEQKGVFRVNCIDCLDRTNVVQSAFARHVLNRQLGAVALLNVPDGPGKTDMDVIFNDSKCQFTLCYPPAKRVSSLGQQRAGTSALKGDFTRTGKRDLGGLLNDGVNSLARMYSSTFSDWFCQAVIDFMLGNRTLSVFSEFLLKLQSTDPGELIRLSKIRAEAIATCSSRVLPDEERMQYGWTLFAPEPLSVKLADKFEEKILLLTAKALYIISYDYSLDKIKMYTRAPLGDILNITKGAYILSPLEEASRDPSQNSGFTITWLNTNQTTRVTSYSLRNSLDPAPSPLPSPVQANFGSQLPRKSSYIQSFSRSSPPSSPPPNNRSFSNKRAPVLSRIISNAAPEVGSQTTFAAFKALPIDPARIRRGSSTSTAYAEPADDLTGAASCKEAVDIIVDAIRRACEDIGNVHGDLIIDGDVVR